MGGGKVEEGGGVAVRDGAGDRDTEGEEIEQVGPPPPWVQTPLPSGSSRPWAPPTLPLGRRGRTPGQPRFLSRAVEGTSQFFLPPTTAT